MRIISGKYRGKKLNSPLDQSVRPTVDRVKESVFNVLQFKISGAEVLDLFAGSGAYGIECLSRNASNVVFNDNSKTSIALLKSNLNGIDGSYEILSTDCILALSELKGKKHKFDIVFLDPPFHSDLTEKSLEAISTSRQILNDDAVIVCEHLTSGMQFDQNNFNIIKQKSYGITTVTYLMLKESRL